MNQKYIVELTVEERQYLDKLTSSGTAPARRLTRAQILLKSDSSPDGPKWKYEQICAAYNITPLTVMRAHLLLTGNEVRGWLHSAWIEACR